MEPISQHHDAFRKALFAEGMSLLFASYLIRRFGADWRGFTKGTLIGASLLAGPCLYWALRQGHRAYTLPGDPLPTEGEGEGPLLPPSPYTQEGLQTAYDRLQKAIEENAPPHVIQRRLAEAQAYAKEVGQAMETPVAPHLLGEWETKPCQTQERFEQLSLVQPGPTLKHTGTLEIDNLENAEKALDPSDQFQAQRILIKRGGDPAAILGFVQKRCPHVVEIVVERLTEYETERLDPRLHLPDLERLSTHGPVDPTLFPHLRHLHIQGECDLAQLARECPLLETLKIGDEEATEQLIKARASTLTLSPLALATYPHSLGKILTDYPALCSLGRDLEKATSFTTSEPALLERAISLLPHLHTVVFDDPNTSTDVIYEMAKYPQITRVSFPNGAAPGVKNELLTPHLLAQVAHLFPFSESLHDYYKGPFIAHALFQIPAAKGGAVENLFHEDHRVLDPLSCALWLADGNYKYLKGVETHIDTLLIEDRADLDDETLIEFVSLFKPKRLSIQRCPKITSKATQAILEGALPGLTHLNLSGCKGLDDLAFVNGTVDFNLDPLQEVTLHHTRLSESYKKQVKVHAPLVDEPWINTLSNRPYSEVLESFEKRPPPPPTDTGLEGEALQALSTFLHTYHFPEGTSVDTLLQIYPAVKEKVPLCAKRIELLLVEKANEKSLPTLLAFAQNEGLTSLKGSLLSYAIASGIGYAGRRYDPLNPGRADFTLLPIAWAESSATKETPQYLVHKMLLRQAWGFE
ncbi:MAG: hypothetical protein AB7F31_01510 [Parachlamydiales bacterium]